MLHILYFEKSQSNSDISFFLESDFLDCFLEMEVTLIKNFSNFNEINCCDFLFVFNNQKSRRSNEFI